jgi:hypothetical protein
MPAAAPMIHFIRLSPDLTILLDPWEREGTIAKRWAGEEAAIVVR